MESLNNQQKQIPTGVKIISILNYIFAGLSGLIFLMGVIGGITFMANGDSFASQIFGNSIGGNFGQFYSNFGLISFLFGILFGLFAFLLILFAINMRKGKNWAKISEIIFILLWIVAWSLELFRGSFGNLVIVVPLWIAFFYLVLSSKVKNFFN